MAAARERTFTGRIEVEFLENTNDPQGKSGATAGRRFWGKRNDDASLRPHYDLRTAADPFSRIGGRPQGDIKILET